MENKKEIGKERPATGQVAVKKNIETILKLEQENLKNRSTAEHMATNIMTYAGSSLSLLLHAVWFVGWILLNLGLVPGIRPFDPLPFSFLTLVVSLEAIFLTLLVLMSQNRMTKEADKRANLDLQINMLDEQETTMILRMVQKISKHLGLEEEINESAKELSEETDVNRVSKSLDERSDK